MEPLEERRLPAITVNTLVDEADGIADGEISLREAIDAATSGETIDFAPSLTAGGPAAINLLPIATGHLRINKNLTIEGPGANLLTIKGYDPDPDGANDGDGHRVFLVGDGTPGLIDVTIRGLTIAGGDPMLDGTSPEDTAGGGIRSQENLTIVECVVTDNYTLNGGGISTQSGTLTLVDSVISGNLAEDGGGVLVQGGTLMATRTTFHGNEASNVGGGIINRSGNIALIDSTVSGNLANVDNEFSGAGGGIASYAGGLNVSGSTISGNSAGYLGGGIYLSGGNLTVTNTTISGNFANDRGGGVFSDTGESNTIAHSTITGNSVGSSGAGGGVHSPGQAQLDHTIVAGNLRGVTVQGDVAGSFAARYSIIGDQGDATVVDLTGSLIGTSAAPIDAMLGPLADNGGLTMTHELLAGSPAIDAGDPAAVAGVGDVPAFDQRGASFERMIDGDSTNGARIDIGAFELAPAGPALPGDYNFDGVVDAADYTIWRDTLGAMVDPFAGADGDGNGSVGPADHDVWKSNFGNELSPPATGNSAGVPTNEADTVPTLPIVAGASHDLFRQASVKPPVRNYADVAATSFVSDYALMELVALPTRQGRLADSAQPLFQGIDSASPASFDLENLSVDAVFNLLGTNLE